MIGRIFISVGLLFTCLIISDVQLFTDLSYFQQFFSAIFNTNCHILFTNKQSNFCRLLNKSIWSMIFVSSLTVLIFGKKLFSWIFCGFSLFLFCIIYNNPWIDSSFSNFIHFIQLMACITGIFYYGIQSTRQNRKYKEE